MGGRLGFGIGEHAPDRVLSLVVGGQQPYAIDPEGPLARVVTESLAASRREGTVQPLVEALEAFSSVRFPDAVRAQWLDNDAQAIASAWDAALAEGAISEDLRAWRVRCLIYAAAGMQTSTSKRDERGRHPTAEFVSIEERDHLGGHLQPDPVLPAVLRTLRGSGG